MNSIRSGPAWRRLALVGLLLTGITGAQITVPEVLMELKDQKTLQILSSLPFKIKTKTPSQEAMAKGFLF